MDSYILVAILIFAFGWITLFYYTLLGGKKLVTHYVAIIF